MSGLFLPAHMAHEVHERRQQWREDIWRSVDLQDTDPLLTEFAVKLNRFDPRLLLVRARETIVAGLPMKPGYYHLLIDNGPDVPLSVTVIEGEYGEFCEPTSRVFEKLMAGDMRERRNTDRFDKIARDEYAANERENQREREQRRDHLRELVNAYTRTSVSMNTARPWTQNNQPNARREAGARVVEIDSRRKGAA